MRKALQQPPGPLLSHLTDEQRKAAGLTLKGGRRPTPPVRQLLMSLASSMPSGQAQVNLGERGLICGAGRHRCWQPPLRRAVLSHQFTPAAGKGREAG